jgi:secondary thiamine-phosphate synthase enzyme
MHMAQPVCITKSEAGTSAVGWRGTREEWVEQEPMNAHSHLLSVMTGSSESVPVVDGKLKIGRWQSIMLVDLDGPRERSVAFSFVGLAQ